MIALYIVLYLLTGFVTTCVVAKTTGGFDADESDDITAVLMCMLLWPLFMSWWAITEVGHYLTLLVSKVAGK